MKILLACLLVLGAGLCADDQPVPEQESVAVLTDANFDTFLKENPFTFVWFYAPWCIHCKQMKQDFLNLDSQVKTEGLPIRLAQVDATNKACKEIVARYEVHGFPMLFLFKEGHKTQFTMDRKQKQMYDWLVKRLNRVSQEITTPADLEKAKAERVAVVYVVPKGEEKTLQEYEHFAMEYNWLNFYFSHDPQVAKEFPHSGTFTLGIIKNFESGHVSLASETAFTGEQIASFVTTNRYPKLMAFD